MSSADVKATNPAFATLSAQAADQKRIEQALRESEERFRSIFELSPLGIFISDRNYRFINVNQGFCSMVGYTENELYSMTFKDMTDTEQIAIDIENIQKLSAGEITVYKTEKRYRKKNGGFLWGALTLSVLQNAQGFFLAHVGIIEDISGRKEMESALKKSEERYKRIADTLTDYIYTVYFTDGKPVMTVHGDGSMMVTGYTNDDFKNDSHLWIRMVHPDDRERVREFFNRIILRPIVNAIEHRIIHKSGMERWVRNTPVFHFNNDGNLQSYDGVVQDITERKIAVNALLSSEERYRTLFNSINDGVILSDMLPSGLPGKIVEANDVFCSMLGYTSDELLLLSPLDITENPPKEQMRIDGNKRQEKGHLIIERNLITKNGKRIPFEINTHIFNLHGKSYILSIARNLTERKMAEAALLSGERRFREMFESSRDAIVLCNIQGHILDCNKSFVNMLGYDNEQELFGITFHDLTPLEYQEFDETNVIQQMKKKGFFDTYDKEFLRKNGDHVPVSLSGWVIYDQAHAPAEIWAIIRDITEKKRMDAEILRTQHLESLGLLAGGIAHDFNNLLGGIFGYIDIAKEFAETPEKATQYLDKALNSLDRAKDLSQRLLTFARGGIPQKALSNLEQLISDAVALALSGSSVKAQFAIDKNLWPCEIDISQISRVINNLALNAKQAMPGGGKVTITAKNVTAQDCPEFTLGKKDCVQISITDQGIGMSAQILDKIFNPFFTTKKHGTGLGLSICQSVVQKHGGIIRAESTEGKGTCFEIFLPAQPGMLTQIPPSTPLNAVRGHGRILIMDDEEMVLELTKEMVSNLCYKVVTAKHGAEAVTLFTKEHKSKHPFNCVILDLTVPGGMGGVLTLKKIRMIDSNVKVIAASGYSNDPVMANPAHYGFSGMIKKPFVTRDMAGILHLLLTKGHL